MFYFISVLLMFFLSIEVNATNIDGGVILQQIEQASETQTAPPSFEKAPEAQPEVIQVNAYRVLISEIEFLGNTNISSETLRKLFSSKLNKKYSFQELESLARIIGSFYRSKGLWAKGILPAQSLENGVLVIEIFESRLGEIQISHNEDDLNFSEAQSQEVLMYGQDKEGLFNFAKFKQALKNLDAVPGITASAVLEPGQKNGYTNVLVSMANTPTSSGSIRIDNHASRSTSEDGLRFTGFLNLDGILKKGDQINGQIVHSKGTDVLTLGATVPFGYSGSRIGGNATYLNYRLGEPLQSLDGHGNSKAYDIFLDIPVKNDDDLIAKVRFDLADKLYKNYLFGSKTSDKRVQYLSGTVTLSWPDDWFGDATNIFASTVKLGDLNLNGYADSSGTEGEYSILSVLFNRAQHLSETGELFTSIKGQYARSNLDSSEKLSLGGPTSVRAYPVGEASGDHGLIISVEYRHQISDKIQGVLFYDHGWVDQDESDYLGQSVPEEIQLKGLGVGMKWQIGDQFEFAGSLASRVGKNPAKDTAGNDSDGTKKDPRLWLSLVRQF